jgi:hypothetical protein
MPLATWSSSKTPEDAPARGRSKTLQLEDAPSTPPMLGQRLVGPKCNSSRRHRRTILLVATSRCGTGGHVGPQRNTFGEICAADRNRWESEKTDRDSTDQHSIEEPDGWWHSCTKPVNDRSGCSTPFKKTPQATIPFTTYDLACMLTLKTGR